MQIMARNEKSSAIKSIKTRQNVVKFFNFIVPLIVFFSVMVGVSSGDDYDNSNTFDNLKEMQCTASSSLDKSQTP